VVEEYDGLQRQGHEVSLVAFSRPPKWVAQHFDGTSNWIVFEKSNARFDALLEFRICQFIRRRKADLILTHCEASAFYAGLAGTLLGIPVVGTIHRSELRFFKPTWRNRLYYRFLDRYIAVSNERKWRLTQQLQLPANKMAVQHWGVDSAAVPAEYDVRAIRRKLKLPEERILLSLGHLGTIKGHDDSIRAMVQIREQFPDTYLYIGGDGTVQDHERLHSLIEELNLQGFVILLGQITNGLEWLMACDIFTLPSREEAFGLVFLEAGLCAKPTVATRVGGIPEIIQHEKTGYLVKPQHFDELAVRIIELLSNEEKRRRMGRLAREHVLAHFDLNDRIAELDKFLRAVVDNPKAE